MYGLSELKARVEPEKKRLPWSLSLPGLVNTSMRPKPRSEYCEENGFWLMRISRMGVFGRKAATAETIYIHAALTCATPTWLAPPAAAWRSFEERASSWSPLKTRALLLSEAEALAALSEGTVISEEVLATLSLRLRATGRDVTVSSRVSVVKLLASTVRM